MKELDELLGDLNAMIHNQAKQLALMHLEGQSANESFDTNVEILYNLTRKRLYLKSIIKGFPQQG